MTIAIIIPSYGRPDKIRTCLAALSRLEGGPYRTIVVDDGTPEPLAPICAEAGDWVTCIRQENAGPATARNTGAQAADGAELLLFTDDDCQPRPDWVTRLRQAHDGVPMRLVGGHVENALPKNPYASASQSLCSHLYDYYAQSGSPMTFFTTNNMACRREDFLSLGGFDIKFRGAAAEDRDFSLRWKDEGGALVYDETAVVDHAHDLTLRSFWRQHAGYGRGAFQLHGRMAERGDDRPAIEPFRFYAGMLFRPLMHPGRWRLYQSFLIGLSQVAMVAGYAAARRDAASNPSA